MKVCLRHGLRYQAAGTHKRMAGSLCFLSGAARRGPPKLFFIIYSLLFISQVFSASHWCMCSRIRAKAVAVSGLCVLKSISFHSQPWSATMQRLSG